MKHQKNIAFYIETLLLTLFILILMSVLVQMFAAARSQALDARALTQAQQIAQNVSDTFYSCNSAEEFSNLSGIPLSQSYPHHQQGQVQVDSTGTPAQKGTYTVFVDYTLLPKKAQNIGQLVQLQLTITASHQSEPLIDVTCEKYLPSAALSS